MRCLKLDVSQILLNKRNPGLLTTSACTAGNGTSPHYVGNSGVGWAFGIAGKFLTAASAVYLGVSGFEATSDSSF